MQPPSPDQNNPYVGPRPFEQEDQARFFGRDREASDLCSLIKANRVMLVYAQSGTGKTSLIKAGLIPMLQADDVEVLPTTRLRGLIPESIPYETIENPYVFNTLISWASRDTDLAPLLNETIPGCLNKIPHHVDDSDFESIRVAIFDQFEELFSFYPDHWQERRKFFEQLRDALAADELLRVVLVMREDYIAQLDPYAALLPDKLRSRFRLNHMTRDAALSAIKRPTDGTTRCFGPGVAEQLADQLMSARVETPEGKTAVITGEFVEPVLLQVVCQSLWKRLPPEVTEITFDHLKDFGDVNRAMSQFYQECLDATVEQTRVSERTLRDWFDQKLITSAGTRSTIYQEQETTGGIPNEAVRVLEDQHLVRAELRAGGRWYELNHDSFIEPIQTSNKAWRARQDIINQADLQMTLRRLRRVAWVGAVIAIVIIVGLAFVFTISQSRSYAAYAADLSVKSEQSDLLAMQSRSLLSSVEASTLLNAGHTDLALNLALQAVALNRSSVTAQHVLFASAYAGTRRLFTGHGGDVTSVAYSPDGQYALSGSTDSTLILWDVATGKPVRTFVGHTDAVTSVAFSPDGQYALSGSADTTLILWVVATGQKLRTLRGHTGAVTSVAFSPDGQYALSGSMDGMVVLWDRSSWSALHTYPSEDNLDTAPSGSPVFLGPVLSVAFSSDGQFALSGGCASSFTNGPCQQSQLTEWHLPDFQPLDLLAGQKGAITSIAFSYNGDALTAATDNTLNLWDTSTWTPINTFKGHTGPVNSVAFSPDGQYAVSGSNDNSVILWDVTSGLALRTFGGHSASVLGVAFSPDGRNVISASQDRTLRLWDLNPPEQPAILIEHSDTVTAVAFSPNGDEVFSASHDHTISMTAINGDSPTRYFSGEDEPISALAVSSDGKSLASGGDQGVVYLWDVKSGQIVQRFFRHLRTVSSVAFSPDGSRIVSGSTDGGVYVWDIGTGQQTVLREGLPDFGTASIGGVAFSPNGRDVLYSLSDDTVHLVDAQTGAELRLFLTNDVPTGVAFSPDGRSALVASFDKTLSLWDLVSTDVQSHPIRTFTGHSDVVTSVAFSPDGQTAVSGSCARLDVNSICAQGEIILWDIATGQALYTLTSQYNQITSVAFSPDGKTVAAASNDHTTALWPIWSVDELVGWIRANRYLGSPTCAERSQYQLDPMCDANATPTQVVASRTPVASPSPTITPFLTPTFTAVGPQAAKLGWNAGYVPANGHEHWTYVGHKGETLALRVNADQPANSNDDETRRLDGLFDPMLTVYRPNGPIIDQNDDLFPAIYTDSVIDSLTLPVDGTYLLDVGSYNNTGGGAYWLVIEPEAAPVALTFGQTVSGTVEGVGDRNQWTFDGTAGHSISLTTSPYDVNLFPCIQLYGTHGQPLYASQINCENGSYGTATESFLLPDTGTYTIVVRGVTTGAAGAYTLTLADLTEATATPTMIPTSAPTLTMPPPSLSRGSLTPGDTVTGMIEPGVDQQWALDGFAGENVLIRMDAAANSGLHPLLELVDLSGTMIATSASYNGISSSAQIGPLTLPYSGSYIVLVASADFNFGAYTLTSQTTELPPTTPTPFAPPTPVPLAGIEAGETLSGTLSLSGNDQWAFDGKTDQIISIILSGDESHSPSLALGIELLAPDSTFLTESYTDPSGVADLGPVILSQTGTYTIIVYKVAGDSISYQLSLMDLTNASPTPIVEPTPLPSRTPTTIPAQQGSLSFGQTVNGTIQQPGGIDLWTFNGAAGDLVSMSMKPGAQNSLLPMLELRGPDGALLIVSPDPTAATDFSDAEVYAFTLPESGVYSVTAEGYVGTTGAYTLRLAEASLATATPSVTPSPTLTPFQSTIVPGTPVSGVIATVGQHDQWTFAGIQGHVVTITLRTAGSSALDSYLELFGSRGLIAADDNFEQASSDSQIALFTLPASENYQIMASGFGLSTGAYTLTLSDNTMTTPTPTLSPTVTTTPAAGSIVAGQTVAGVLPPYSRNRWVFNAVTDEVVTLTLSTGHTIVDTYFELDGPGGTLIEQADSFENPELIIGPLSLPATGTYTVIAHTDLDLAFAFQLNLVVGQPSETSGASPTPTPAA